ncbi:MAG: hypothetical protein R3E58_00710 [Phycisphaerae bacterium]
MASSAEGSFAGEMTASIVLRWRARLMACCTVLADAGDEEGLAEYDPEVELPSCGRRLAG